MVVFDFLSRGTFARGVEPAGDSEPRLVGYILSRVDAKP